MASISTISTLARKASKNILSLEWKKHFRRELSSLQTEPNSSNSQHQNTSLEHKKNIHVNIKPEIYDVFIVGGGVTGTALLYYLNKFTNLKKIGICERRNEFAKVASAANNNSQTIHCGDIETNYSLSKATTVKKYADMLRNHVSKLPQNAQDKITGKFQKMALGVGDNECSTIEQRFNEFKDLFPAMQLIGKSQIAKVEPHVAFINNHELRPENLNGIFIENEHSAVNYKALADNFVDQAKNSEKVHTFLNTEVEAIQPESEQLYNLKTNKGNFQAKFVIVSSCGYSLLMAHQLGYGLEYSCMPVSGSFYFTPSILNGKVYTVQNPELPFAAIHGDPDLVASDKTRFGPTGFPSPMLERYNPSSIKGFLKLWKPDLELMSVYWSFFKNSAIRNYVLRNIIFELPHISTRIFLKDVQKIIPSMKLKDLTYANGFGGIRPQLIDKKKKQMLGGEGKISPENLNIIFNITPSPGATTCLGTADKDARVICHKLGAEINEQLFEKELLQGQYPVI